MRLLTVFLGVCGLSSLVGLSAAYRDRIELIGDNERVMISAVQSESGEWNRFMVMRFRRV
jgi:hypothetical protein